MKLQLNNAKSFYCCIAMYWNLATTIYLANLRKSKIVKICLSFRLQTDVIFTKLNSGLFTILHFLPPTDNLYDHPNTKILLFPK